MHVHSHLVRMYNTPSGCHKTMMRSNVIAEQKCAPLRQKPPMAVEQWGTKQGQQHIRVAWEDNDAQQWSHLNSEAYFRNDREGRKGKNMVIWYVQVSQCVNLVSCHNFSKSFCYRHESWHIMTHIICHRSHLEAENNTTLGSVEFTVT